MISAARFDDIGRLETRRWTRVAGTFLSRSFALKLVTVRLRYFGESERGSSCYLDMTPLEGSPHRRPGLGGRSESAQES